MRLHRRGGSCWNIPCVWGGCGLVHWPGRVGRAERTIHFWSGTLHRTCLWSTWGIKGWLVGSQFTMIGLLHQSLLESPQGLLSPFHDHHVSQILWILLLLGIQKGLAPFHSLLSNLWLDLGMPPGISLVLCNPGISKNYTQNVIWGHKIASPRMSSRIKIDSFFYLIVPLRWASVSVSGLANFHSIAWFFLTHMIDLLGTYDPFRKALFVKLIDIIETNFKYNQIIVRIN